jgi:hypothetical protein
MTRLRHSHIRHSLISFPPVIPVKTSVLDRFCKMFRPDFRLFINICNGPGYLENTVEGTGRKTQFLHCIFQDRIAGIIQYTDLPQYFCRHLGIPGELAPIPGPSPSRGKGELETGFLLFYQELFQFDFQLHNLKTLVL